MLTVTEAFRKFRKRLGLTKREQEDAASRQREIRDLMSTSFEIQHDFLTGSYKRWTKTKPLKDVDIFCVLHDDERPRFRDSKPAVLLGEVERVLALTYGSDRVKQQRRSVQVEFPHAQDEELVMSFDVVPAFTFDDPDAGGHYEIPDTATARGWTETDPREHAKQATAANRAFGKQWKGMVRMIKAWNNEHNKPIKPSFLLEVMALDLLRPPFNGDYSYEFLMFFRSAADRIHEEWPEPAGLGPPVSDLMDRSMRDKARHALDEAHDAIRVAINLSRADRNGDALRAYRQLFGPRFPLS